MENAKWKAGAQFNVKAQVAADTIRRLQRSLGTETVTAKDLLDASRDDNAPLHSCFEWDDSIAAEQYRLWQARHLINSLEIEVTVENKTPITTRLFVNVKPIGTREPGSFTQINAILKNPNLREIALNNALIELRSFQRKYAAYEELTGVFNAIDSFGDTIK